MGLQCYCLDAIPGSAMQIHLRARSQYSWHYLPGSASVLLYDLGGSLSVPQFPLGEEESMMGLCCTRTILQCLLLMLLGSLGWVHKVTLCLWPFCACSEMSSCNRFLFGMDLTPVGACNFNFSPYPFVLERAFHMFCGTGSCRGVRQTLFVCSTRKDFLV